MRRPDIYVRTQGLDRGDFLQITSATLMVSSFVILLQIRQSRHLGAGLLLSTIRCWLPAAVLPVMYLVVKLPGESIASVFGMLSVVGLSQIGFSYLIMRNIFTVEVSGMVVMLIGLGLGQIGLQQILGDGVRAAHTSNSTLTVASVTFIRMVGCNVWGQSLIRLMAPLLGLLAAMVPKLIGAWLLPAPVIGALLPYLATFTILNGLQLIASRMLDNRRVLAVGTGVGVLDSAAQRLWPLMHNLTQSGLAVDICVTVAMSVIFRLGVRHGAYPQFELNDAPLGG